MAHGDHGSIVQHCRHQTGQHGGAAGGDCYFKLEARSCVRREYKRHH